MQGLNTPGSPQRGVIPRSFEVRENISSLSLSKKRTFINFQHIFEASAVAAGTKYLIRASYLEIYNESIRDLLGKDVKATLDLKVKKKFLIKLFIHIFIYKIPKKRNTLIKVFKFKI